VVLALGINVGRAQFFEDRIWIGSTQEDSAYTGGSRHRFLRVVSLFSVQQLRHGLPVFRLAAVLALLIVDDDALRPRLADAIAGVGLDGLND
jgi:hypothetical protein